MDELKYDRSAKICMIILCILILVYVSLSFYFRNHFYFRTSIDGINISCKTVEEAKDIIYDKVKDYKLEVKERNNETEEINSNEIDLIYVGSQKIDEIKKSQKSYKWGASIIDKNEYKDIALFSYNDSLLNSRISRLKCLTDGNIVEPKNPEFQYTNGEYIILEEVYGNKVNSDKLFKAIKSSISEGDKSLDIDLTGCYENPKYTKNSEEVIKAKEIMDTYVSSKIVYTFDENVETVDGAVINPWIDVDENMEPVINEKKVKEYVDMLSKKYNTVGKERKFESSVGKTVVVMGGHYGWKINTKEEVKALTDNIKHGQVILKEPSYSQKALYRSEDDIGNTYVEVNITRQHLWFYKDGKLIVQGDVVTGCQSKNTPTYLGVYPLNYKQKGATLKGAGYSSKVTYWMPFNGNIGLHDASWRSAFGGSIYKTNGTHGCVNLPKYVAKTIFENIDADTPIICYSEETKSSDSNN